MTILLVDDDLSMRKYWIRCLAPLKAEILQASSVEEAREQMKKIPPPDVLLLDLGLPPMNASETLSEVRALREHNPNLVIIAISGMAEEDLLKAVAGTMVNAAITKDDMLYQDNLLKLVKSILETNKKSTGALLKDMGEIARRSVT